MSVMIEVPLAPDYFEYRPDLPWSDNMLLTHGPLLVRSRAATRWHRPRSGVHWPHADRVSWHYWCGQSSSSTSVVAAGSLPKGDKVCATCEGRALGAGYPAATLPPTDLLLFTPTLCATPEVCPGSRDYRRGPFPRDAYETDPKRPNWATCLFCGSFERLIGGSRGYSWTPIGLSTHKHADLIPPCPNHGWLSMTRDADALVCRCSLPQEERTPS